MANSTDPFAQSVHGTNPQYLVEKITRLKIYNCTYWKEECFGLTAKSLIDKAIRLKYCGGNYGGNIKPTKFLCLVLKMLQLQPEQEIVIEYIKNENFKYLRALGAFYLRLTGKADEVYRSLEPLLYDFRPIIYRGMSGWSIMHMDEFIDSLLREELVCDITLPHMVKRIKMEELKTLPPRKSNLEKELIEMAELERLSALQDEDEEDEDEEDEDENEVQAVQNKILIAAFSNATSAEKTATIKPFEAISRTVAPDHSTTVIFEDDEEDTEVIPTTSPPNERYLEKKAAGLNDKADRERRSRSKYSNDEDNDRLGKKDRDRSRSRDGYDERDSSRRRRDDSRDRHHGTSSRSRRDDSRDKRRDNDWRRDNHRRDGYYDRKRRDSRSRSPENRHYKRGDGDSRRDRKDREDENYHRQDRHDSRDRPPKKKFTEDKHDDEEEFQAYSSAPKQSLDDKKIKNEKRFDRMFGKKDSASSSSAANKNNVGNKKALQGGKEIVNDKGEKFLITAPEGSVEYWNQIRESLGMKKLKS